MTVLSQLDQNPVSGWPAARELELRLQPLINGVHQLERRGLLERGEGEEGGRGGGQGSRRSG